MQVEKLAEVVSAQVAIKPGGPPASKTSESTAPARPVAPPVGEAEQSSGQERPVTPKDLAENVRVVNESVTPIDRRLDLYVVEGTHQVAAKIVNTKTNQVVKYIPPEEFLKLRSRLAEMRGILLNEGA